MNRDCIFCSIVRHETPATLVYEDERVAAFLDHRPLNPGHTLIVPRLHAASLAKLDPADGGLLFQTAQKVAAALRASGLRCDGVSLRLADGAAAGQDVMHVHLHVIPRFVGDGNGLRRPAGHVSLMSQSELEVVAGHIRAGLG